MTEHEMEDMIAAYPKDFFPRKKKFITANLNSEYLRGTPTWYLAVGNSSTDTGGGYFIKP